MIDNISYFPDEYTNEEWVKAHKIVGRKLFLSHRDYNLLPGCSEILDELAKQNRKKLSNRQREEEIRKLNVKLQQLYTKGCQRMKAGRQGGRNLNASLDQITSKTENIRWMINELQTLKNNEYDGE